LRASSRLLGLRRSGFGWRQWQSCGVVEDLPFLRRKSAEAPGLEFPLAHLRRHSAKGLDGISHRLAPLRRQTLELRIGGPELVLLLRRQVLPSLHALQDPLLALRRHAVEVLESLFEFLLALRRKPAKITVVLECLPLLFERLIAVLIQPLTGMMTFGGWLIRSGPGVPRRLGGRARLILRA